MTGLSVSHVGLCVSDLDRSLRFYCDGLGFSKGETYSIGNEYADAMEVPRDVVLTSQFIWRDGLAIELLHFASPGVQGEPSRARNHLGLTHLSFVVDDLDGAVEEVMRAGGSLLDSTRAPGDRVDLVFVADPDGVRIELMQIGGRS